MCRFPRRNSSLALAAAAFLGTAAPARAADPVVAEQGTHQLTAAQVHSLIAATDAETRKKLAADPAALKSFLRDYLLGQAILAAANDAQWDRRPEIAALAQRAHDNAIAESFLQAQSIPPATYPSETEIQAAYTQNRAQLMQPRSYHLTQIFAAATGTAQDGAKRTLGELRTQILHGRLGFENAASHAPGTAYGDLGWLPDNRLQPAVRTAIAGLPEGQTSTPVCTDTGCTLLKLIATRPAGPPPLADIRENLIKAMRQQKQRQLEQIYANALLAKQPVRVDEIQLSHVTAP